MGAWGEGPFDNDDASDLVGDLSEQPTAEAHVALGAVLAQVVGADGYIEAPDMSRAIAAAAVVALSVQQALPSPHALEGPWRAGLEPASPALAAAAAAALTRAMVPEDNEWFELWEDAGLLGEARNAQAPYIAALEAVG